MKKGIELKQHFHTCMPLFIALGDEIRLTIIEALTDEALTGRTKNTPMNTNQPDKNDDRPISLPTQPRPHGLNVREITERTSLSRPAVSHHLKILKTAGLIDVHREGTCNYYYLSIEDSTRKLMPWTPKPGCISFHFLNILIVVPIYRIQKESIKP